MGGIYRWSEWAPPLIFGGNSANPSRPIVNVAGQPYTWPAGHPAQPPLTFGIRYLVHRPSLTRWQSGHWNGANTWSDGQGGGVGRPTLARLCWGFMLCHPLMSYYPWLCLILDILKICMDFGPYDAFPSSDVSEIVDQQNSWNSLVISTYLLYLAWNVSMLVENICILWPPTPPPPHTHTLRALLIPEQRK
jgi:hypothetical protein